MPFPYPSNMYHLVLYEFIWLVNHLLQRRVPLVCLALEARTREPFRDILHCKGRVSITVIPQSLICSLHAGMTSTIKAPVAVDREN